MRCTSDEAFGRAVAVADKANLDEHLDHQPDRTAADHRGKALDDAGLLQRFEAPRARRRRQADLLRQFGHRLAPVALQDIEHLDLEIIELRHFHSFDAFSE